MVRKGTRAKANLRRRSNRNPGLAGRGHTLRRPRRTGVEGIGRGGKRERGGRARHPRVGSVSFRSTRGQAFPVTGDLRGRYGPRHGVVRLARGPRTRQHWGEEGERELLVWKGGEKQKRIEYQ